MDMENRRDEYLDDLLCRVQAAEEAQLFWRSFVAALLARMDGRQVELISEAELKAGEKAVLVESDAGGGFTAVKLVKDD